MSQVPHAIHVPACQRFPINCASLDRRPYQLALGLSTFPRPSARTRSFRSLHLTLTGRGVQRLSCPYRLPSSTPISRITRQPAQDCLFGLLERPDTECSIKVPLPVFSQETNYSFYRDQPYHQQIATIMISFTCFRSSEMMSLMIS
jgi:hypothetical protein